jgi:hypothetical protein
VCHYRLKIYTLKTLILLVLAVSFSFSVLAQGRKHKDTSSSKLKICTGGVVNNKVLFESKPAYSKAAKEVRAEEQVIVIVRIDEMGKVYEATACAGHKLLRQTAVDAAYQTQIAPTKISNQAVKVSGILLFIFKLENSEGRLVDTKIFQ